jgi:hypothetical protein
MNPQPVIIHGVRCFLQCWGRDDYRVRRWDTGAEVAQAPRRFLAIARAAAILHAPGAA